MTAKKRDANHGEIKAAIQAAGLTVFDTANFGGGFPDLVAVRDDGRVFLVEVKVPEGQFTKAEVEFIIKLCNPAYMVFVDAQEAANSLCAG